MKKNNKLKVFSHLIAFALLLSPMFIFAQTDPTAGGELSLTGFINNITTLIKTSVVGLLFAVAFLFFFYGVVQYTINPSEEAKDKGRGYMTWGLIGLTVMFSVYALINIIKNSFLKNADEGQIQIPNFPGN